MLIYTIIKKDIFKANLNTLNVKPPSQEQRKNAKGNTSWLEHKHLQMMSDG